MENIPFYIQYLHNQPVKVETHYIGELERRRPLTDVGGLVAAYKTATTPLLDGISLAHLTIHSAVDGPAIAGNVLLASIQNHIGSYEHPLIIKSKSDASSSLSGVGPSRSYRRFGQTETAGAAEKNVSFESRVLESLDSLQAATTKNSRSLEPLVQDFVKKFYYTNDTRTKVSRSSVFKNSLLKYYYGIEEKVSHVKCMISNAPLPSTVVIAGHLFKSCWAASCQDHLDFEDIDNPRNGLLMFKPFEFAFDNSHICFLYDSKTDQFKLKILNPLLKPMTIKEYIKSEKEINENSLLKSRDAWISELNQQQAIDMDAAITAVDNLMASMSQIFALNKGWIKKEEVKSPSMFTELEENNKERILEWMSSLSQDKLLPTSAIDD
ncbi:hypothetical protein BDEG_23408 [Batrachochytrium dendrobatidis JEL423]|uniref:HNH nuclease domain-containing protein n=1 Tax=Batrachochytrium dendrobatidis (strain JEL423) TaxID=403673 RepID=A0A177WIP4_BATDL|nr:hypothetical protein BDEG_23408 [Batrachochytrium dendrobatidis JEL423]